MHGTIPALPETGTPGLLAVFRSKRMAVLFLLGFSGGLPNLLTSQTLQAWLNAIGVEPGRIANPMRSASRGFFATTAAMALPGLLLAWWVARDVATDG